MRMKKTIKNYSNYQVNRGKAEKFLRSSRADEENFLKTSNGCWLLRLIERNQEDVIGIFDILCHLHHCPSYWHFSVSHLFMGFPFRLFIPDINDKVSVSRTLSTLFSFPKKVGRYFSFLLKNNFASNGFATESYVNRRFNSLPYFISFMQFHLSFLISVRYERRKGEERG